MKDIERRVSRLESSLGLRDEPETLEEMFAALMRGDYGRINLASVMASILSNGQSVEHLRGELPDPLVDFFAQYFKDTRSDAVGGGTDSL